MRRRRVIVSLPLHPSVFNTPRSLHSPPTPKDAEITAQGPEAQSEIEQLRFHDFRGTAATKVVLAVLAIDQVALILGLEKHRVELIAVRYVTGDAVGRASPP